MHLKTFMLGVGMVNFAMILMLVFIAIFKGSVGTAASQTREGKNIPLVIECNVKGYMYFGYFDSITPEGDLTYLTPDRRGAVRVKKGILERVGGGIISSCTGKHIEELISEGRAYFITLK